MGKTLFSMAFMTILTLTINSCSSVEGLVSQPPRLYQLRNTECLIAYSDTDDVSGGDDNSQYGYCTFQMTYREDLTTCDCKFNALSYPCDFGKVNIVITYNEGVLTIVEYPSFDSADCRCPVDAEFTINNLPVEDFVIKIYHGDTSGEYNPDKPRYVGNGRPFTAENSFEIPY